jgi:hypothetical protein
MKTKPGYVLLVVITLLAGLGCARTVVQSSGPQGRQFEQTQNRMVYYLPKGVIRVQYKPKDGGSEMLVETQYVPDPEQCYLLEHTKNYFYKDDLTVSLTSSGLLDKISVTSEARIGSIVMQLVDIAKGVTKLMTLTPGKGVGEVGVKPFDIVIEPDKILRQKANQNKIMELRDEINKINNEKVGFNNERTLAQKELEKLNNNLEKLSKKDLLRRQELILMVREFDTKINLKDVAIGKKENEIDKYSPIDKLFTQYGVEFIDLIPLIKESSYGVGEQRVFKPGATDSEAPKSFNSDQKGIYYRPVLPYMLTIRHRDYLLTKVIYLPNYSQPISIDVNRPGFVEKIQELTFDNGILKIVHVKRPSEAEGLLAIPVNVVKEFVGLPLELLQFKVDHGTVYNQLLQQQIQQLKNERELMELKMKDKME